LNKQCRVFDCPFIQKSGRQLHKGYKTITLICREKDMLSETTDLVRAPVLTAKRICRHIRHIIIIGAVQYNTGSEYYDTKHDKLTSLLIMLLDLVI
jgi:hypothetical protein